MAIRTSDSFPTDKQIQYVTDLLVKKDLRHSQTIVNDAVARDISPTQNGERILRLVREGKVTRSQCSTIIDELRTLPNRRPVDAQVTSNNPTTTTVAPPTTYAQGEEFWEPHRVVNERGDFWVMRKGELTVPRGSYGLETPGKEFTNNITFFSVWVSDDGSRWTVRMYVSDERVKISRRTQYAVLAAIAQDPAEAAEVYGKHIGKCGICGRKLTNDASRARGIGPVCAENFGW